MAVLNDNIDSLKNYLRVDLNLLLYKRGDIFELSVQTPPRALDLGTCNFNMFCAEVCRVMCKNPFFDILNGSGKNPEKLICNTLKTTTDGSTK